MAESILTLESRTWDVKKSQDRTRIRDGPEAIGRIIKKTDQALKIQANKAPKLTLSRKKRDFYFMRQKTILDDFRTEKTGLDMLLCDGEASILRYYENRANVYSFEVKFIQPNERALNSHLHKHKMRLTGYPKTLIESLHDRENTDDGNELAATLWNLQRQMCAIVGGEKYNESDPTCKPSTMLHMITVLQLGEIIFTRDVSGVEDKASRVVEFFQLCVGVISDLYDWTPPDEIVISPMKPSAVTAGSADDDQFDVPGHGLDEGSMGSWEDGRSLLDGGGQSIAGTIRSVASCSTTFSPGRLEYIPIVLTQCVKTLKSVLMSDASFIANRDKILTPQAEKNATEAVKAEVNSRKLRRKVSSGSKIFTEEEAQSIKVEEETKELDELRYKQNQKLCESLTNWLYRIAEERKLPTLFQPVQEEYPHDTFPHTTRPAADADINELAGGYVSYPNTLVTDILVCAKCAVHILIRDSRVESIASGLGGRNQDLLDCLVEAGGELVAVVLKELSGLVEPSRRVGSGDTRAAESIYNEAQACFDFVSACFAAGCISDDLKTAIELGRLICTDCRYSLVVQSSWLQAVFSAVMCLLLGNKDGEGGADAVGARILAAKLAQMKAKMNEDKEGEAAADQLLNDSDRFYVLLGKCITDVMMILKAHPTASSLQHLGLLVTRIILRPPFLSKRDIEVFLEGDQAADRAKQEEREKKKKKKKKKQATSVEGGDATESGGASMLAGGNDDDDDVSVESLTDWKEDHRDNDDRLLDGEENLGGGENSGGNDGELDHQLTLSHVLHSSGEANLQSTEVMEQWLLLIHHLAGWSALARETLVNAYVDNVVSKVISLHVDNVYLLALSEMCIALIQTEEEEYHEL